MQTQTRQSKSEGAKILIDGLHRTVLLLARLLVPVCLAGCKVGPDYERPEIEAPDQWRIESEDAGSLADAAWWELFDDPILQGHIEIALEQNKDLRIAIARIDEARGALRISNSRRLPQVDAAAGARRDQRSEEITPGARARDTYDVAGGFGWEIDLWGKLERATEAAYAELLSAEHTRQAVVLSLITDVAILYFQIQDLDRRIEITGRTVNSRQESLRIAVRRFEAGETSELEVRQAQSQLAEARRVMPDLKSQLAARENELSILLGRNPGSIRRSASDYEHRLPETIPAGLPVQLLERRPDVRRTEEQLVAASARIGVAEGEFLPSLSLSGALGFRSRNVSTLFNDSAFAWETGAQALAPLYQGGRLKGNLEVAEAQFVQARLLYERVVLQSFREVNSAMADYTYAADIRQAQEELVRATQAYSDLAYQMYEAGEVGYIEFLDAQRQLFNAELSLSQTVRQQLTAFVSVYKALGGGWSQRPSPDTVSPPE